MKEGIKKGVERFLRVSLASTFLFAGAHIGKNMLGLEDVAQAAQNTAPYDVTLNWQGNPNEISVTGYTIVNTKDNGVPKVIGFAPKTCEYPCKHSFKIQNLQPGIVNKFTVRSINSSREQSPHSNAVKTARSVFRGDNQDTPSIKIDSSKIQKDSQTNTLKLEGTSQGLSSYDLTINGVSQDVKRSSEIGFSEWSKTVKLNPGNNYFEAKAVNAWGNTGIATFNFFNDVFKPEGTMDLGSFSSPFNIEVNCEDQTKCLGQLSQNGSPFSKPQEIPEGETVQFKLSPTNIIDGSNNFKVKLTDSQGNTQTLEKIIQLEPRYSVLVDGEKLTDLDNWRNIYSSRGEDITQVTDHTTGKKSMRLKIKSDIAKGGRIAYDFHFDTPIDMRDFRELGVTLNNQIDEDISLRVYYHSKTGGWFDLRKTPLHLGENNIRMPHDLLKLEGSGHGPLIDKIRFAPYNQSANTLSPNCGIKPNCSTLPQGKDYLDLNFILGINPKPVIDLDSTSVAAWRPGQGAEPIQIIPDKTGYMHNKLLLPADLYPDWRDFWDVNIQGNYQNVENFRVDLTSWNSDSPQTLFYFRDSKNTWMKLQSKPIERGFNQTLFSNQEFRNEGGEIDKENLIKMRYCTRRYPNHIPKDYADTVLHGIFINDLIIKK